MPVCPEGVWILCSLEYDTTSALRRVFLYISQLELNPMPGRLQAVTSPIKQTPSYQLAPGRPMAGHRFDTAFFWRYWVSNRLETDGRVVEADARAQTQFHYYYRRFAAGIDGVLMPSLSRMTAQKHRIEQDSCGSNDDSSTELDAIACMTSCSHYWLKGTWQRSFVLSWHFRSCTYTPSPHCLKIMFLTRPV